MKRNLWVFGLFIFLGTSLFIACQSNSNEGSAEEPAAVQAQPENSSPPERPKSQRMPGISAVAWSELQALLPNTVAGLPRTNSEEDKSDLGDLGFSHALGLYSEGDREVQVQFLDCGSQKTILSTVAPWFGMQVDSQEKTGFERSTTIKGYPAIEQMNMVENSTDVGVVIKDRFVVVVSGKDMAIEELRKVMDGLDLSKLEKMQ